MTDEEDQRPQLRVHGPLELNCRFLRTMNKLQKKEPITCNGSSLRGRFYTDVTFKGPNAAQARQLFERQMEELGLEITPLE